MSFFAASSFGCSLVMWRADLVQSSFRSSNAAGVVLLLAWGAELKGGVITRTSSRNAALTGA